SFLTRLRNIKPELTGQEIRKLGFKPGPIYQRILNRLMDARLDGQVKTKEEEIRLIRKEFL
ncbi:MAG: hypothetical protein COZ32_03700, partial [Nitrospirae bacterium CG_4_10_14_3_um_filter_53_41]